MSCTAPSSRGSSARPLFGVPVVDLERRPVFVLELVAQQQRRLALGLPVVAIVEDHPMRGDSGEVDGRHVVARALVERLANEAGAEDAIELLLGLGGGRIP